MAVACPDDHMVVDHFRGYYNDEPVLVTAVLERTCVIQVAHERDKRLVRKSLIFVEEGFTLAVVDQEKVAQRQRAARGWQSNWQRRQMEAQ